ncbi:fumarylacetoacetate hydrolase family protein [Bordetella sp. BOR01]|uniref:fumarylacetoacetate hydrolase family protein n=1 Tax=Bordetella sp. BOR01 TaxID=2854779 RepID=UPI001C47FA4D|nr:fumarylacetoacetate hydrolase family protein [Bordetella sp. BOR01]
MKLGSFRIAGRDTYGAISGDAVIDLGARLGPRYATLRKLLAEPDGLAIAREHVQAGRVDASLAEVAYLPVVPDAEKIFCIGVNYADHLEETRIARAAHPTVFLRYAASQVGHDQAMLMPRESAQLDYECEVAVVIGKAGRRIAVAEAWSHVAGYACYNDGSVRDWQMHTSQWGPGKNFLATGGFGPWMTTADELDPRREPLQLTTRLNGEVMQHSDTSLMIFGIGELIAYCSTMLPLAPGDVIVTGTPGGVGMARKPPRYLAVGDTVEVEVSGVGILRNRVQADQAFPV